jgi:hypothetical protein
MTERTSTCDPHAERERLQVYLHVSRALSVAGGHGYFNQHLPQRWKGRTNAEDQALLRWPPRSSDLMPCEFLLQEYVEDGLRRQPVYRICLRCEDESSPPSQKSIVTYCSGYGRKWIVDLTSAVPQRADTNGTSKVCQKNKNNLESFSFHWCGAANNPCRHSSVLILWNVSRNYE